MLRWQGPPLCAPCALHCPSRFAELAAQTLSAPSCTCRLLARLQEKMGAPWAHWGAEGNRFAPVAAYMKRTIRDVRRKVKQLQAAEAEAVAAGEWQRGCGLGGVGSISKWARHCNSQVQSRLTCARCLGLFCQAIQHACCALTPAFAWRCPSLCSHGGSTAAGGVAGG